MKTKIVVDSSSSLYALPGVDFACVPLKIVTDEQEYLDDGTLDAVDMARSLRTYKGKTSTSCPNVADWLAAYEGAEQIFVATITGTLSGSYNAALLAAEEYKETHPEARVFVLDSLSAGPELRLLAERLRDLVRIGMEFDEICEAILAYHKHTHLLFSLESLANLARNGRVKPAVAAVARMLGIRVIGQASESGELEVLCKTRGEHGALERIVLELKDHGFTDGKVHIAHCDNPEAAKRREREGVRICKLRFTVDAQGRVLEYAVVGPSGNRLLDRATQELIRRAQPLPPPPRELLSNGRLEIVAPIVYELKRG